MITQGPRLPSAVAITSRGHIFAFSSQEEGKRPGRRLVQVCRTQVCSRLDGKNRSWDQTWMERGHEQVLVIGRAFSEHLVIAFSEMPFLGHLFKK